MVAKTSQAMPRKFPASAPDLTLPDQSEGGTEAALVDVAQVSYRWPQHPHKSLDTVSTWSAFSAIAFLIRAHDRQIEERFSLMHPR